MARHASLPWTQVGRGRGSDRSLTAPPLLLLAIFLVALLYASVGHAGASGYIAAMALLGVGVEQIRPTALVLNLVVATIGTALFARAGHFSWHRFWPFAITAPAMAFLGGSLQLPVVTLRLVLGIVLLLSAIRLFATRGETRELRPLSPAIGLAAGAGIGFLAGLTGTGGGIFLTPLLLFAGWATAKQAAAVSAPFILLNSLAGLGGYSQAGLAIPALAPALAVAALAGGFLGARLGATRLPDPRLRLLLAMVLGIASAKLLFFS